MNAETKKELIVVTDEEPGMNAYMTEVTPEEAAMLDAIAEPMDEAMKEEVLQEIADGLDKEEKE